MRFIDYSLQQNSTLQAHHQARGPGSQPRTVQLGPGLSTSLTRNTGAPQGCVLSPFLYSLFTHDCVAMHAYNSIIKFADGTTVVGLITNNDETAYWEEVSAL